VVFRKVVGKVTYLYFARNSHQMVVRAHAMKLPFLRDRGVPRGQSMVELALVLPLLVLLVLIAVDFGRIYFSYIEIHNAAREGAKYAAQDPSNTALITSAATRETNSQAQSGESVLVLSAPLCKNAGGTVIACATATTGGSGPGNTVTIRVAERFSFLTPIINNFFGNNFQMTAASTSTIYGFVASGGGTPPGSCSGPTAAFSINSDNSLMIAVDPSASTPNSGVCNISGYNWTWGDGNTDVGSASGSTHTYAAAGTYTIQLQVTNQGGPSTITHNVTVPAPPAPPTCAKPTALFTWTRSGSGNKTYTYTDLSTVADPVNCPITNWLWTFTDLGTSSNAKAPAPQTYGNNGSHPVTLQVTNAGGTSSITLSG
jgi:PKD repeat protein